MVPGGAYDRPSVVRSMTDSVASDPLERIYRDMIGVAPAPASEVAFPGFTIRGALGAGGFGVVYRAREERLQRDVALKVLRRDAALDGRRRERFFVEARVLARVRHPNVLVIHGVLEHEGEMALCTELIEGASLARLLDENGRLEEDDAIRVGIEACNALNAVHAAGIVHRDVKTGNLLLEHSGRVVLADFGLGALSPRPEVGQGSASRAGSPNFMSPEQAGGVPVDFQSDIYSLGVVLYNLVTGAFPFEADEVPELLRRIREEEPVPLERRRPDLSPGFAAVVRRAMAKDPGGRFPSAHEMEQALRRVLGAPASAPAREAHRAALTASLVVLACLAPLWGWWLWRPGFAPAPEAAPVALRLAVEVEESGELSGARDRAGDAESRAEESPGGQRLRRVRLMLGAERPLHVYLLQEDARGRKYLLFPDGGGANPVPPGRRMPLPGAEDGWLLACDTAGESVVIVAATEAIGPLEDARPPAQERSTTGRRGEPRLKPVSVRGLFRCLQERDPRRFGRYSGEEPSALLGAAAVELEPGPMASFAVEGIWLGRVALTEAAAR